MERLPLRCPTCNGTYTVDNGENKCLSCSRGLRNNRQLSRYYIHNKEAILAAVKRDGQSMASMALKIPKTTLYGLVNRWSKDALLPPAPGADNHNALVLPPLPVWSDTWPEATQVAWLEIYRVILNSKERRVA